MINPPVHELPQQSILIGNHFINATSHGEQEHVYAATGQVTRSIPLAGTREVERAVQEAGTALSGWRTFPRSQQSRMLNALGEAILRAADSLAFIQTVESAVPISFARQLPEIAANHFFHCAGWVDKAGGEVVPSNQSQLAYTLEEPYGVVGAIVPWNVSLVSTSQVLAPILAAGNTVVIKPSPLSPYIPVRLAQLALEAGIPPGVINVIPGDASAGEALVRHCGISKIHFAGSRATASNVLSASAANLTPACLELGGKSPLIIFADGDLMAAATHAMSALVGLSGQGCALATRVLIEVSVYDKVLTLLKGLVRRIRVGDPLENSTQMGPLISIEARERVLAIIEQARTVGTLVTGGHRLEGDLANGAFIAPTIFTDITEEHPLNKEEVFGPVINVMSFRNMDHAIGMANATRYGLTAYLYTEDLRRAHQMCAALEAGAIWVNGMDEPEPSMPFGGYKQSGYGRLGGRSGIREFTRTKSIVLKVGGKQSRVD